MKHLPILLISLLFCGNIYAQTTKPGYYITKESDTVSVQIKIQKGLFGQINNDFTKEISIREGNNDFQKFYPSDIKGYGFKDEGFSYVFASKPTKKGHNKFLEPVITGQSTSLYRYGINMKGNGSTMGSNQTFYTFEKSDGSYLFLTNILNKKFRAELKEFYKDNAEAQIAIDSRLKYWEYLQEDIYAILSVVNKS